ncbi:FliI/YscN family ATPase [Planctomycetota bacterium]
MATGSKKISLAKYLKAVDKNSPVKVRGRVVEVTGLVIEATVPGVRVGDAVDIHRHHTSEPLIAEVVGFRQDRVLLMPLGDMDAIGPDSEVIPHGSPLTVKVGPKILGRVLNGIGEAIDTATKGPLEWETEYPVMADPPDPLTRKRVLNSLSVGVRAIDGCLTVGEGQRIGFFAGAGVGKSTLMGMIARNCEAEINVVGLIGERGREVLDFIEESLGEGMKKSVVVVATSDRPSLVRKKAAYTATAICEYFRDQGKKVLLMMDSVTRFARAQREVGLAIGEPPARQGYTPSVFSELPRMLERSGNSKDGSITAFYTILAPGGDMSDPVAEEVKSILDGHIVMDAKLGARNHWPAIDVTKSLSRVMTTVAPAEHCKANGLLREVLATYEKNRDLIAIGAYERGSDKRTDWALDKIDVCEQFLRQRTLENPVFGETVDQLKALFPGEM